MAQIARLKNKSLDNVDRFELNKLLKSKGFDPLTATETTPIKDALKNGPYPTLGMVMYSFEYWFNYFYKELPSAELLVVALNVINDDGSLRTEAQVPDKDGLFQKMLRLGFRRFEAGDHLTASEIQTHAATDNPLQRDVNILFRGDSRLPDQIKTQGTMPQTQVDYLRRTRGMNQPWHPFRNTGNAVWVRNGEVNKDNCLFSAVSVTPQFAVATKFPLLNGLLGESPELVGHAVVVVRDLAGANANLALSAFARARQKFSQPAAPIERNVTLLASKTSIYAVIMRGAYNTQKYQGDAAFPEYASDNLDWGDHLIWFSITRVHFSQDANHGHLIIINDHKILHPVDAIKAALLGPNSWQALQAFVDDIVRRGTKGHDGTGGIAYTPPGVQPPFEIVRVKTVSFPEYRPVH